MATGSEEVVSMTELLDRIAVLQAENHALKESQDVLINSGVLYFISRGTGNGAASTAYLDEPTWSVGNLGEVALKAHFPIPDVEGYVKQQHDIAFMVAKFYEPTEQEKEVQQAVRSKTRLPQPQPSSESIRLESEAMVEAMEAYIDSRPLFQEQFRNFNIRSPIPAPYLFWYYDRSLTAFDGLSEHHRNHMNKLTKWIEENYGEMYGRVDTQLQRGFVSYDSFQFLIQSGDAVVVNEKSVNYDRYYTANVATSYPVSKTPKKPINAAVDVPWKARDGQDSKRFTWTWRVQCWTYKYNGSFYRCPTWMNIKIKADEVDGEVPIQDLNAYPLRYASDGVKSILEQRGRTFWKCRERRIVSYEDNNGKHGSSERFMVDFQTYRQLHSDTFAFKQEYDDYTNDPSAIRMDNGVMKSDNPPASPDIYAFPRTIIGYNLRTKKWVDLEIDRIRDVVWNKKSFSHLVIDDETKEIIEALITNQIAAEQGTDIIENKGNGLIILLHGGPGTGKTFTAESVAEYAEKPLYRVTCGDIGTKPEDVEKYLESVLHLSKIWGCVVLLDEADVFLEERALNDLERNALVSVFLRVLEYYEGILILTSNRVGTFDEAFKSRIQLSLHYKKLDKGQRQNIWKNFIRRLKAMDSAASEQAVEQSSIGGTPTQLLGIDFDDIENHYEALADYELNGRQIRNAITTARQLAKFKGKPMRVSHLRHVIQVAGRFDEYLKNVHEGFSDDEIARSERAR